MYEINTYKLHKYCTEKSVLNHVYPFVLKILYQLDC